MSKETVGRILQAAENLIREGGYHAFSFRQIADQLGIKSASIHYHFPTKEKLGETVARGYAERFKQGLGLPDRPDALRHFATMFRGAIERDGKSCLCGVLAAESGKLSPEINRIVLGFARDLIAWLEQALIAQGQSAAVARDRGALWFYALQGAIHFSALEENVDPIDIVERSLSR